jgi:hypothetical protein
VLGGFALANVVVDGVFPNAAVAPCCVDVAPNVEVVPTAVATGRALDGVVVELANLLVDPLQFMEFVAAGAGGGGVVYAPRGGAPY